MGWAATGVLRSVPAMTTLHIEHRITDLDTWVSAFDRFAEVRRDAGVTAATVRHLHDDERSIVVDLEFDTEDGARAFLGFLEEHVWAVPANSPALVGSPEARLLDRVVTGGSSGSAQRSAGSAAGS